MSIHKHTIWWQDMATGELAKETPSKIKISELPDPPKCLTCSQIATHIIDFPGVRTQASCKACIVDVFKLTLTKAGMGI